LVVAPPSRASAAFPADSLHILVVIDGSDDLHISPQKATWIHKTWGPPTAVQINGVKWNPQQSPVLTPRPGYSLLRPDLELCGAVLHKLRGRGAVEFGFDRDGLAIHFDDSENGADTYEVSIDFAQTLARKKASAKPADDLELRIKASIDGTDEVWLAQHQAKWVHTGASAPAEVTVNGRPWEVIKHPVWELQPALLPETMDLQRATMIRLHGRGIVNLDYRPEQLCLDFEDREPGADHYELALRVPRFREQHLVRIKADVPDALLGAALQIYRLPEENEARALLSGQRFFDVRGQCLAALEPGQYQFEVLHQPTNNLLVALKTGLLTIAGPTNLDLKARRIEPRFFGPENQLMSLNELLIRSTRRTGAVSWKAPPGSNSAPPTLLLSQDQGYKIHAFGHAGTSYAAIWKTLMVPEFSRITLDREQWLSCSFRWQDGTPHANRKGAVLQFPDGQMEIAGPESARFFTNRRFFNLAYWLAFPGELKAVFQPRGCLLAAAGNDELPLGGPLRPVSSAAILQNENLGRPDAVQLWWEITLADPQNYLLDTGASKLDWVPALATPDGSPVVAAPLLPADVKRLGNLKDTLVASASFRMGTTQSVSLHPEVFVSLHSARCTTLVPPYHDWNTRAYLAKAERELKMIAAAHRTPLAPDQRMNISWWFNSGAVGANNSVTMPFPTYLDCRDWFSHPWAIAHEMLHNFGYGHTHEMDRLDRDVQERMDHFHWFVADRPDYVPEDWAEPPRP
jgi:hypothetical protein